MLTELTKGAQQHSILDWTQNDITTLSDIYEKGTLLPFQALVDNYGLNVGRLLTYNSMMAAINTIWHIDTKEPPKSEVKDSGSDLHA